ncbi:hypothetical protein NBRC111894_2812 [Sporolactobacillus inulinus]|uniref:Uncharacterized protein n=1 Tax=Sporolactobacillus inulinus TaxID=2078 RepID=A0A4Y1ZFK4_9BACL|nr:hypothetical protein NBRC111894_2812 [Sporolactobacillus inulinus]
MAISAIRADAAHQSKLTFSGNGLLQSKPLQWHMKRIISFCLTASVLAPQN